MRRALRHQSKTTPPIIQLDAILRRSSQISLLIMGVLMSFGVGYSVANASPLTTSQVEEWLRDHEGITQYELTSRDGGRAVLWEDVKRDSNDEIHLWQAMERVTHRGRPRDNYIVERRRFKATPPFNLIGFDAYHLEEGEARALSWRALAEEGSGIQPHTWIVKKPALELRQTQRADWRRGVAVAARLWRDQALTSKAQRLQVHETLRDHLNLRFSREDRRSGYQLSVRDHKLAETRFTISRYDERITRRKGRWETTRELKIVSDSGESSSVILNAQDQMLALHIGDQLHIVRDGDHPDEVKSRTIMMLAKGRLTQGAVSELRSQARSVARSCGSHSSKQRLKARLHISPQGSIDEVSFDMRPQWGDVERCLAGRVKSLSVRTPPKEGALVSVSISL